MDSIRKCLALGKGGIASYAQALFPTAQCDSPLRKKGNIDPGFDPESLERAAKALREIQKSPYAKQAIEVSRQQEITRQKEEEKAAAQAGAEAAKYGAQAEQIRGEESRKLVSEQAKRRAEVAQYEDELARKRQADEHEKQRQRNAEVVQMKTNASLKIEAEKLRVEEEIQRSRIASENERAKIQMRIVEAKEKAKWEGKSKDRRVNADLYAKEEAAKNETQWKIAKETADIYASGVKNMVTSLLEDRYKAATLVGIIGAGALRIYSAKRGTRLAADQLNRYFNIPTLVRETSRNNWYKHPVRSLGKSLGGSGPHIQAMMKDVILPEDVKDRVNSLSGSMIKTKERGAHFRHMLFYGPPGTGKTMTAKIMAKESNMDFAILTGGDVAPLGGGAVTQLHSLFKWASRPVPWPMRKKGMVLFIDEADAFLRHGRAGDKMEEDTRQVLSAFLHHTGTEQSNFSVILATNQKDVMDRAVLDRMDEWFWRAAGGQAERSCKRKAVLLTKCRLRRNCYNSGCVPDSSGCVPDASGF